ncbi:NAD(P)-dependent dehydrogenase (short-subunit alcohol dehydrogenase family) [Panacagrimonas perspica]|uniref:NAD(P)-dependent dehydrogenase (Short-subunit alcohol dehydrogenase family) n=1 Tax=Panacagrimonas perspica TaxID=381431 RepID=A0A4R7P2R5_9GAMM|nr:SDR family oxidoreductase [Panacagrimonas perspica]TDU28024.1 NAD(P)-dependent dehydrogenase (short-subunit alcohol dehydrogenase family) [Panacagrimonas perspica]THD03447.1 short-chain dehydrogenase [Panacagrimonas perspica]
MAIWVVTGADRGIGAAMCVQVGARGDTVIAACLDDASAVRGKAGVEAVSGVDVTSESGVHALLRQIGDRRVDVVVNNAGLVIERKLGEFDYQAFQREFAVNTLGPLRVTEALLPRMGPGGKIGIVTSRVGSLSENGSGGLYGYRISKAAANMAGINLSHELKPRGIAVILLHPGSVRTRMTAALTDQATVGMLVEPEVSAKGLIARVDELSIETTGTFRHANGQSLPW